MSEIPGGEFADLPLPNIDDGFFNGGTSPLAHDLRID